MQSKDRERYEWLKELFKRKKEFMEENNINFRSEQDLILDEIVHLLGILFEKQMREDDNYADIQ